MTERKDVGKCYYCEQPVMVSEGQLTKFKVIKMGDDVVEHPTHKWCRKNSNK